MGATFNKMVKVVVGWSDVKPVEICWGTPNSPIDLSCFWAEVHHIARTYGEDISDCRYMP